MSHIPGHLVRASGEELKAGDTGDDVKIFQIRMAQAGCSMGAPTGVYDDATDNDNKDYRAAKR